MIDVQDWVHSKTDWKVLNTASNYSQNLSAALSQISDVDYASESANLTKFQIMQQAMLLHWVKQKRFPNLFFSLLG